MTHPADAPSPGSPPAGRPHLYATFAAWSVIALGGLVLVGWVFHIESLMRIRSGLTAMNPTTAAAFMLSGLSLLMLRRPSVSGRIALIARGLAGVVLGIGLMKLAHVSGVSPIAIDGWLNAAAVTESSGVHNAMAPNTALLFVLVGGALLLLDTRVARNCWVSEPLSVAAMLLATVAFIGYLYGVRPLFSVVAFIPMSLHAAVGFLLLSSGTLASRTDRPIMTSVTSPTAGGVMIRRVMPGVSAIVLVLAFLRLQGQKLGLYDSETGVVLMCATTIAMMGVLAFYIARSLDAVDLKRGMALEELRRAELTLRSNNELMSAVLENIADGIVVVDRHGGTLHANPAATSLIGATTSAACVLWTGGERLCATDKGAPLERDGLGLVRAVAGDHVPEQELYLAPQGREPGRWLSVSAQPLSGAQGRGAVGVVRDITVRKLAERRLEDKNELLEALVETRTCDLRRSNQDLQQFAYVASHDLQEPLRMVGSYLQLLERRYGEKLDDQAREFIGYAVDGATRMKQLINDLLQYSRVESKGGSLVETDPRDALNDVLVMLGAAINESGVEITASDMPRIKADPAQLRQLFQNLIGNAIKFRAKVLPKITVTAEADGPFCRFTITDNGIGIEPQYTTRIFEVFQRLHSREEYPGTGIGLAICKKIVERHGGRIWVEPAPDAGSRFVFTITNTGGSKHELSAAA